MITVYFGKKANQISTDKLDLIDVCNRQCLDVGPTPYCMQPLYFGARFEKFYYFGVAADHHYDYDVNHRSVKNANWEIFGVQIKSTHTIEVGE